jgi:hypothetical protein
MDYRERADTARDLMLHFAGATGLWPVRDEPRRYLWTDAFAVCNFLSLYRHYDEQIYLDLTLSLVEQVHRTLGRHRPDDIRSGWISGLGEVEGAQHPTAGGLRIGKKLPERSIHQHHDTQLEWERDGQYLHYLTKWMHALCCVGAATGETHYAVWAGELAEAAWRGFSAGGGQRLVWKASIDLSRPLVASMGHHDPLDGYLTCREIGERLTLAASEVPGMAPALSGFEALCTGRDWTTPDPLGLGGLLFDAARLAQLAGSAPSAEDIALLRDLLQNTHAGLSIWMADSPLGRPAAYRLAFRELGLSIGLNALPVIGRNTAPWLSSALGAGIEPSLRALEKSHSLADVIENFWLKPESAVAASWREHDDINTVMLATSLVPEGFLNLT